MIKLLKFLKDYKWQCIIAPFFKFLEACFEVVVPILMKTIIDSGINFGGEPNEVLIYKYIGLIILMGVLGVSVAVVSQYFSAVAGMGMGTALRRESFSHLNNLTNKDIDKLGGSSVVTRLTSDINQVANGVNRFLRLFLRTPFILIGAVTMSFIINPIMGVIVLASIPVIFAVVWFIVKYTIPRYKDIQTRTEKVSLMFKENLEGVRVVRAFSTQKKEIAKFDSTVENLSNRQIHVAKVASLLHPLSYAIANIAIVVVLWLGGNFIDNSIMTTGEVASLVNYLLQILTAIVVLTELITIMSKAQASAVRVNEFLETKPSFTDDGNTEVKVENTDNIVEFNDVTFSYNENRHVLENINLKIRRGETLGIIGETGSGKTSLINLIPRLYDVDNGEVLVNGVNVKKYPFDQLRKDIAIAVQHAVLFKGTIRSNLQFANPNASDDDMYKALKIAQAYDFVMEKEGLDTEVAAKGSNFSGGQKQRLNVARAVIQNPKILMLDDSSSALDYATDFALRKSLKKLEGLTTIIVSQRVASVMQADNILVLEDGKIAGYGTHKQLYGNNEVYTEIYDSQTKGRG